MIPFVQCCAEKAGIGGCQAPVTWVVTAELILGWPVATVFACGRHLNRVCAALRGRGAKTMTLEAAPVRA